MSKTAPKWCLGRYKDNKMVAQVVPQGCYKSWIVAPRCKVTQFFPPKKGAWVSKRCQNGAKSGSPRSLQVPNCRSKLLCHIKHFPPKKVFFVFVHLCDSGSILSFCRVLSGFLPRAASNMNRRSKDVGESDIRKEVQYQKICPVSEKKSEIRRDVRYQKRSPIS